MYGDPFLLLPARFLEGALGIRRVPPAPGLTLEVIVPLFDHPEIAFANGSARVFCPSRGEGDTVPLNRLGDLQDAAETEHLCPRFPREARRLAEALEDQRPMRQHAAGWGLRQAA